MRAGDAAARSGDHSEANEHFRAAMERHRALGNEEAAVTAAMMTARNLLDSYSTDAAGVVLAEALERHTGLAGHPAHVALEGQMARYLFFVDEMAEAIEVADRVLDRAEHHNLTEVLADTLITKGSALAGLGRSREGLMLVSGGGDVAEAAGLSVTVLRASINRGFSEGLDSQWTGFESARTGIALARRLGLRSLLTVLTGNAAEYAIATGDWDWAERELAGLGDDLEPSHRSIIASGQAFFADVRGRDGVTGLLEEVSRIADALGDPSTVGQHLFTRGWHHLLHGRLLEAQRDFDASAETVMATGSDSRVHATRAAAWRRDRDSLAARLRDLEEVGEFGRSIEAARASFRGALMALDGRTEEAVALFRQARRAFADLQLPWLEGLSAMDALHTLPMEHDEWAEARTIARTVFEDLGAIRMLAQVDAIEAGTTSESPEGTGTTTAPQDAVTSEAV
jgi:hypothetical protein